MFEVSDFSLLCREWGGRVKGRKGLGPDHIHILTVLTGHTIPVGATSASLTQTSTFASAHNPRNCS